MPKDFHFFGHFVLLVTFEILTCYPNINGSHWFSEEDHWITAKVFRENLMASTLSSRSFPQNFWFCLFLLLIFKIMRHILMFY